MEELWTVTQSNRFFYKQLKKYFEPYGFCVWPKGSRYFVRFMKHYVQVVYQEIIYGETSLQLIVTPTFTYQNGWFFFGHRVHPKCSNELDDNYNFYGNLAIELEPTMKKYYKSSELMAAWNNVIITQLKEEVIDYFEQLNFQKYQLLCVEGSDEKLNYGSSCDALRFYAAGYNSIWQNDYDKAEEYLEKGILAAEDLYNKREQANGSHDLAFNKDLYTAKEILEILQRKEAGWEKLLEEKLFFLEKDALEKVWGIVLDK